MNKIINENNIHWSKIQRSKIQIGQKKTIFRKNRKEIYLKDLFPIFFFLPFPGNGFYLYLLSTFLGVG